METKQRDLQIKRIYDMFNSDTDNFCKFTFKLQGRAVCVKITFFVLRSIDAIDVICKPDKEKGKAKETGSQ